MSERRSGERQPSKRQPDEQRSFGPRPNGRRRAILKRAAVVVAAIGLVFVLPGYLGSRPGFFGRFPATAQEHETWAKSTHLEAACSDCHVPPRASSRAAFHARMVGEFYLALLPGSRAPKVLSRPTNAACLACHNDLRSVSPKGDLQIPHRAHVQILKMECVQCHDFLVHQASPEGKNTPPMSGCLGCHDGDTADNACTSCHTEKAAPATHRSKDWLVEHSREATDEKCAKCHRWAENWCAECHAHRPRSHGRNWRAVHGEHVKTRRSCEACHETKFCVPCHGEVPGLNFDPALKVVR